MLLPEQNRLMAPSDPAVTRRAARRARRDLPPALRDAATLAVRDALLAEPALRRTRRVAAYIAQGAELDLAPFLHAFRASGREVLLPRLAGSGGRMRFARHDPGMSLARNRHGIPEPPRDAPTVAPRFPEVVLLPLVAFDAIGTRLGSGAGYYDRCFAFRTTARVWHAPLLVGVAFACQEVPTLQRQPWDVPLDAVVTEHGLRRFPGAPR